MSENKDTRTAGQKIEDLERVVAMLYQTVGSLDGAVKSLSSTQQDMALLRDALRLLNKKTEAIIQTATPESGITSASVSDLVIKMNVEDLKAQVEEYVKRGNLTPADEVSATSYVVCEEQNADGTVANPRLQFRLDSQDPTTQAAFAGKKAGDTVNFGEGKFSAKILELYTLVDNPAPAPAQDQSAATPDAQTAAPAADNSTGDSTPATNPAPAETAQETAPAAYTAPVQDTPAPESPVAFGLNFHGQPESTLSNQNTTNQS
jgi:uncharacterized coiled-coil protein SlyX